MALQCGCHDLAEVGLALANESMRRCEVVVHLLRIGRNALCLGLGVHQDMSQCLDFIHVE